MLILALLMTALASVVPLSDVRFDVAVSGPLADVEITQTFQNDSSETVEAVYLFPLHERAVVDAMVMRLDDRTIEGRIEEIEAARIQYEQAIALGQTAALTESVRWNVFRQTVGNIPPGARIEVSIRIIQPVPRNDGEFELVLPLVAGARFVPPGMSEAEAMNAPYGDSPVRAHVDLSVDGGVSMRDFRVTSHPVFAAPTGDGWEAHATDLPMTRDFVAKWATQTDEPQVGALYDGEHLLLVFEPPEPSHAMVRRRRELVLVLDQSGSMGGSAWPLARKAAVQLLQSLQGDESLDLITFAGNIVHHGRSPATPNSVQNATNIVLRSRPQGVTDLRGALATALALPPDPTFQRYIVLLSDGLVGNETGILQDLAAYRGDSKIYALGVGGAVNRFVLEEVASQGGGVAAHLRGDDGLAPVAKLLEALDRPALSEIEVDWGDWGAMDMAPARIPDVHLGRPIQVLVRTKYEEGGPIVVSGRFSDAAEPIQIRVQPRKVARGRAIASTWARQRIEALGRRQIRTGEPAVEEGLPLALEYSILSPWTAFIAIDPRVRQVQTASIDVPLGQPDDRPALLPDSDFRAFDPAPPPSQANTRSIIDRRDIPAPEESSIRTPTPDPTFKRDKFAPEPPQKNTTGQEYEPSIEYADSGDEAYVVAGAAIADSTTGTFSANFNYEPEDSRFRRLPSLSLTQGWGRLRALGGTTGDLRRGDGELAFSAPLAYDRFAVAGDVELDLQAIDGGSWRALPAGVQTSTALGYAGTRLELGGNAHWVSLEGPTLDTFDADRHVLRGFAGLYGPQAYLDGELSQARFDCQRCDMAVRTVGTARLGSRYGQDWSGGTAEVGFVRTGFQSTDALRTADVRAELDYTHQERVWVHFDGRADALWANGFRALPSVRAELGFAPAGFHMALGGARVVDTRIPELSLPTLTEGYAVLFVGDPPALDGGRHEQGASLELKVGWQRATGPLALPIARLQVLPEGSWSRDALVTSATLHIPSNYRGELAFVARHTAVVDSDAVLDAPSAPWTPGLLVAHRPLFAGVEGRWVVIERRWSTDLEVSGGLASPVGGTRWWSGWQGLADLGLIERIEVGSGGFSLGIHGVFREGRPGDLDPMRPDGWFAPERLGSVGVFGSVEASL